MFKRVMSTGSMFELQAPTIMQSADPRRIACEASDSASKAEASRLVMVLFGPRASNSIDT